MIARFCTFLLECAVAVADDDCGYELDRRPMSSSRVFDVVMGLALDAMVIIGLVSQIVRAWL